MRRLLVIKEVNGIKVAILASYSYGFNGIEQAFSKRIIILLSDLDEDKMKAEIERAERKEADITIIMPQMGVSIK